MLYRVYIDEAGNRGVAGSDHFIVSAVIVPDPVEARVRGQLAALREALGRMPNHVLHFRKFAHSQSLKAVQDLAQFDVTVTNVIIAKPEFDHKSGMFAPYIVNADPMYLWALRLLLERISWFVRDQGGGEAVVTFAHIQRFRASKLYAYRDALERSDTKIAWSVLKDHPFRIDYPRKVEMLQVADTAASALFKAIEQDQYGNRESRYLDELRPVLYRRYPGNIVSYGLKVFPAKAGLPGGSLDWLRAY